ncbi:MAG: hypothetical protein AAF713_15970 [Pseudomonadota bacterium]
MSPRVATSVGEGFERRSGGTGPVRDIGVRHRHGEGRIALNRSPDRLVECYDLTLDLTLDLTEAPFSISGRSGA